MITFLTLEFVDRHNLEHPSPLLSGQIGAGYGIRTRDFQLGKLTLYQLS